MLKKSAFVAIIMANNTEMNSSRSSDNMRSKSDVDCTDYDITKFRKFVTVVQY
jgi:hypothetical protein